ncbi:unnamed protein product, partial [Amoebophrya sp. A120]
QRGAVRVSNAGGRAQCAPGLGALVVSPHLPGAGVACFEDLRARAQNWVAKAGLRVWGAIGWWDGCPMDLSGALAARPVASVW